jgi:hypothetical protein
VPVTGTGQPGDEAQAGAGARHGWPPRASLGHAGHVSERRLGRVEVGATGVALTALMGEWLAHTIEYMRVSGPRAAFGSVHVYMGPIGVVLAVAALAAVHSTARLARVLQRRVAELRRVEAHRSTRAPGFSPPLKSLSVPTLAFIVWAAQCGLYLLQENLEAGVAHRVAPGLAVLGGAHALAPLVHLGVALALVAGLWLTRRQVSRLARVVRLVEAWLRSVRRAPATVLVRSSVRAWTPIDRWGTQLWSRPPPAPRVA